MKIGKRTYNLDKMSYADKVKLGIIKKEAVKEKVKDIKKETDKKVSK